MLGTNRMGFIYLLSNVTHEKVVRNLFMGQLVASLAEPPDYWIYNTPMPNYYRDRECDRGKINRHRIQVIDIPGGELGPRAHPSGNIDPCVGFRGFALWEIPARLHRPAAA